MCWGGVHIVKFPGWGGSLSQFSLFLTNFYFTYFFDGRAEALVAREVSRLCMLFFVFLLYYIVLITTLLFTPSSAFTTYSVARRTSAVIDFVRTYHVVEAVVG